MVSVTLSELVSTFPSLDDGSYTSNSEDTVEQSSPPIRRMNSFDMMHGVSYDAKVSYVGDKDREQVTYAERHSDVAAEWQEELSFEEEDEDARHSRSSSSTRTSEDSATAAWSELERAEETESREDGADEVSACVNRVKAMF